MLSGIHTVISSCCGDHGLGSKLFHKNDGKDDVPDVPVPSAAPTPSPVVKPPSSFAGFTDKEAKYEDIPWSKLPLSARKAAKVIGFDEKQWDDKEWLEIDDKHWHDLTPEERKACETLGWDAISWDHKYEDQDWEELPPVVKRAAEKIGYNKQLWDGDEDTESWHKGWDEFTKEEQRALHVLGYYLHTWD